MTMIHWSSAFENSYRKIHRLGSLFQGPVILLSTACSKSIFAGLFSTAFVSWCMKLLCRARSKPLLKPGSRTQYQRYRTQREASNILIIMTIPFHFFDSNTFHTMQDASETFRLKARAINHHTQGLAVGNGIPACSRKMKNLHLLAWAQLVQFWQDSKTFFPTNLAELESSWQRKGKTNDWSTSLPISRY